MIIMQRSVSDQTSAPANDIPPPVADHRSRSLVTEGGRGQGAGPASGHISQDHGARQIPARPRTPVISPSFPGHEDPACNVRETKYLPVVLLEESFFSQRFIW